MKAVVPDGVSLLLSLMMMRCWLGSGDHHGNDGRGRQDQQQLGAGAAGGAVPVVLPMLA